MQNKNLKLKIEKKDKNLLIGINEKQISVR